MYIRHNDTLALLHLVNHTLLVKSRIDINVLVADLIIHMSTKLQVYVTLTILNQTIT